MRVGYARVSTVDQNPELQLEALRNAGCEKIFVDKASGADRERPQLFKSLAYCHKGDQLVVWKLDRLGRSLQHLLAVTAELDKRGVSFCSLTQQIDTTTATGRLMFHFLGGFAEFERELIRERTLAGLAVARSKGKKIGRKRVLDDGQVEHLRKMRACGVRATELMAQYGLTRATFYREVGNGHAR